MDPAPFATVARARVHTAERRLDIPRADLPHWFAPTRVPVAEVLESSDGRSAVFGARHGPFRHYQRTVVTHDAAPTTGTVTVTEQVALSLAMPFVGGVFARLYLRAQARRRPASGERRNPAWNAPAPLTARAAQVLGALVALAFVAGYLGTVLTTTVTFAAEEFGAGTRAQGIALAVIRGDILIAMPLAALADRIGRRRVLRTTAVLGTVGTALCALSPNLVGLAALQVPTRGCVTVTITLIGVILVEEMPAGSRAWSAGVLVAAAALGSALTLVVAPVADLGPRAWRVAFALPLVGLLLVRPALGHVPESQRFRATTARPATGEHTTGEHTTAGPGTAGPGTAGHEDGHGLVAAPRRDHRLGPFRNRLMLLAGGAALLSLFITPATQFNNDYLRRERLFSAGAISVFGLLTAAPGALGLLVGGRFADTRGKRLVVGVGVLAGVGVRIGYFQSSGALLWVWGIVGSIITGLTIPGQAIYGPELFPTAVRAKATSVITLAGRIGGIAGLVLAGWLGDGGHLGRSITWLALSGAVMGLLVLTCYPETAGRELEDLNPSDSSHSATASATTPSRRASE